MLEAELRLRAKAYIGVLSFALGILISAGLFSTAPKIGAIVGRVELACQPRGIRFSACSGRCLQ